MEQKILAGCGKKQVFKKIIINTAVCALVFRIRNTPTQKKKANQLQVEGKRSKHTHWLLRAPQEWIGEPLDSALKTLSLSVLSFFRFVFDGPYIVVRGETPDD